LHGYVVKDDGREIDLVIGENDDDPVLTISDLMPHLARKVQADKKVNEAFPGEKLNLIVGCLPLGDDETKNRFKLAVLNLLHQKYGLVEADFISAEMEVVPAGPARDVGLDRGLIGGYGHDDRICAYASLQAILQAAKPSRSLVALFVDREETGSDGATGAKSRFLESLVADLLEKSGQAPTSVALRKTLLNTKAISADVEGAIDPDFQDVHEKNNAARLGYGPCVTRYTGSGGKYGASEAPAQYMGWLRGVFRRRDILWQSSLLGKIDEGGGGTVAMFLAKHGLEIVDCGPSLLGMHSPFEIASKADLYMAIKAYQAFYEAD
ncbi:MAG: aminopeptidase, partial [Deltaproteobacteria bacterium]|nr:aminopeptidase [Deltaproteobacteria bacterium]